jgi:WD40 repeat protein
MHNPTTLPPKSHTYTHSQVGVMALHKADVVGLTHHPTRNMLASFAKDRTVKLWA